MNTRPNILLFLTDDHAAWALGCSGDRFAQTPNIDYLAAEGVQMVNAYTTTPVCSPARASLFTGRMPSQHGLHDYLGTFQGADDDFNWMKDELLLSELLQKSGYDTALVGKWHLGQERMDKQGFDYAMTIGPEYPIYHDAPRTFYEGPVPALKQGFLARSITDAALNYLRERRKPDRPFFLVVGHYATHSPWKGHPERLAARYRDMGAGNREPVRHYPFGLQRNESLDPTRVNPAEALCQYYAGVSEIDESVGSLLDELKAQQLLDETMVIYTSDHGLNCGQHGIWGKGNATYPLNMVEESIRVPLIWYGSGQLFSRQRRSEAVNHTDLFATILDAAGINEEPEERCRRNSPGHSFFSLLTNRRERKNRSDILFCEYGPVRAAIKGNIKLCLYPDSQPDLLFDLGIDPGEERNRYDCLDYREIRDELTTAIEVYFSSYSCSGKEGTNTAGLPRFNMLAAWEDE